MPMAIHLSTVGIVRCATAGDVHALARLRATHGTDALPFTAGVLATWRARGPLLVLELADGSLAGVASLVPDHAGARYLAVCPTLGPRGVQALLFHAPSAAERRLRREELVRRASYVSMMVLSLPGLIASAGGNPACLAIFLWSALACLAALRRARIPRAVVLRRHTGKARIDRKQT